MRPTSLLHYGIDQGKQARAPHEGPATVQLAANWEP